MDKSDVRALVLDMRSWGKAAVKRVLSKIKRYGVILDEDKWSNRRKG